MAVFESLRVPVESAAGQHGFETGFFLALRKRSMGLEELTEDIEDAHDRLEATTLELDDESQLELAMLQAALENEDSSALISRAIHMLFQSTVETGKLDFHLRGRYNVTYDEYLSGMTYEDMPGMGELSGGDEDRRYQF